MLFHAGIAIFPAEKYWHARPVGSAFDWGYAGICYFFVLSGFVIAHVHARDIGRGVRLRRYLGRRFIRIYPVYWIVMAGVAVFGASQSLGTIVASILLVGPDIRPTVLAVAWTLYHEVAFYAVFAAWIIAPRVGLVLTLAWLALIAATAMGFASPLPAYLGASINLLFGVGVAAWWLSRHALPGWLAVAGIAAFAALAVETVTLHALPEPVRELAFGLAAGLTIAALVAVERQRTVAVPRPLLALGAASYSIYLMHFGLLSVFAKLAVAVGLVGWVPPALGFAATVAATLAAGYAFHRLVERPLLHRLQRR